MHRAKIQVLEDQVDKLEAEISIRSAEFRVQQTPITLDTVQRLIPANSVLVEFYTLSSLRLEAAEE